MHKMEEVTQVNELISLVELIRTATWVTQSSTARKVPTTLLKRLSAKRRSRSWRLRSKPLWTRRNHLQRGCFLYMSVVNSLASKLNIPWFCRIFVSHTRVADRWRSMQEWFQQPKEHNSLLPFEGAFLPRGEPQFFMWRSHCRSEVSQAVHHAQGKDTRRRLAVCHPRHRAHRTWATGTFRRNMLQHTRARAPTRTEEETHAVASHQSVRRGKLVWRQEGRRPCCSVWSPLFPHMLP